MNAHYEYDDPDGDSGIEFYKGQLSVWVYSYYIDSTGSITLSNDETRKLYEAMKQYYEATVE
jgi:hypothetical protein